MNMKTLKEVAEELQNDINDATKAAMEDADNRDTEKADSSDDLFKDIKS